MSASDIILARRALRTAVTHLMDARVGVTGEELVNLNARISALRATLMELQTDINAALRRETGARA